MLNPRICGAAIAMSIAAALVGCAQPQTRGEFVKVVGGGAATTDRATSVSNQSLDSLVTLLEERSKTCLSKRVERSGMVGGQMEVSATEWHPTVRRVSATKGEFTLQIEHWPRGVGPNMPEGGFFM